MDREIGRQALDIVLGLEFPVQATFEEDECDFFFKSRTHAKVAHQTLVEDYGVDVTLDSEYNKVY